MAYVTTVYCTDEDLAVRASGDFPILCPPWQGMASGSDGMVDSGDLWTLSSPTVDFSAAGLVAGHVVKLTHRTISRYGSGWLYAVSSASSSGVTLRNVGMNPNVGVPPAPIGGMTSIVFEVPTLAPQIEEVSYRINRDYRIEDALVDADREVADLYDVRELRELCVLMVLHQRYTIENRSEGSDYKAKIDLLQKEIDELSPRIRLRWGPTGDDAPPGGSFSMRSYR